MVLDLTFGCREDEEALSAEEIVRLLVRAHRLQPVNRDDGQGR